MVLCCDLGDIYGKNYVKSSSSSLMIYYSDTSNQHDLPRPTMVQFKDNDDVHKAVVCVQEGSTAATPVTAAPSSVRGFAVPSTADELHHAKSRWSEDSWQFKTLRYVYISMLLVVHIELLYSSHFRPAALSNKWYLHLHIVI